MAPRDALVVDRDALVVDDDTDGREALARLLEAHGYTVRSAENGQVAIERISERIPYVMVLDLEMPVMSGWEVLAWTRQDPALRTILIVVLTGESALPTDVPCLRKPCLADQLFEMIPG